MVKVHPEHAPMAYQLTLRHPAGELRLGLDPGQSIREALDGTEWRVRAACGGSGTCGACLIRLESGQVTPHTVAEYLKLDAESRSQGIRLACQVRLLGDAVAVLDEPAPPSPWKSLPVEDLIAAPGARPELVEQVYGVAVDLGTTHIRVALWDRKTGRRIATRRGPNPQGDFGADVLNRLEAARANPVRAHELATLARDAIVNAVRDILARDVGEVSPMLAEIGQVLVVGNSAMLALLSERGAAALLDTDSWTTAIDCQPRDPDTWRTGWRMPHADIVLAPPLAGFVGSDLLADLIACDLTRTPGALLLDLGTNTEIALWDGNILRVTSVPGGPAFEAVGVRHGMAAEPGAIRQVTRADGGYRFSVIGGGPARGYCGSGLTDAIAALRADGRVKPSGRFAEPPGPDGFRLDPDNPRSAVTGIDIDAFQRAKAATAAAMAVLLDDAGLAWADLDRLVVCGAFGRHLDIGNAQALGLLPSIDPARVELFGDAALAGCETALLDPERLARLVAPPPVRFMNMALVIDFDARFIGQLRLMPLAP